MATSLPEKTDMLWPREQSKLCLSPLSQLVANILQVAYYLDPLVTRARMLECRGRNTTFVLSNDEPFGFVQKVNDRNFLADFHHCPVVRQERPKWKE